ncbi:MAG: hypothetical protein IJ428_03805, partial [Clostridia bacterium]|nr:hypothetical protein [Clostridia bacterium]
IDMKKFLLPETGNFYKANLHCHTECSDGNIPAVYMKKKYVERGYSIVAFSDHDVLVDHSYLNDENFLTLLAFEMDNTEALTATNLGNRKNLHMNCFSKTPHNRQPYFYRTKYSEKLCGELYEKYKAHLCFDVNDPGRERVYSFDCINEMIAAANENGFLVALNHPVWSRQNYGDYMNYKGLAAVEMYNYGGLSRGYNDYCPVVYDDILRSGQRLFLTAGDDYHNEGDDHDHDIPHGFGAYTMIKAPSLEYGAVIDALMNRHCYTTMGPEIHALWVEDGRIHIKCSPARSVSITCGFRRCEAHYAKEGEVFTETSFELREKDIYYRLTVTDHRGNTASSCAYFVDEMV